jgi:ribosomal protein S12 methylthiotransferase
MEKQAAISLTKLKNRVGKTLTVLVDEPGLGRSKADAPRSTALSRFRGGKAGQFRDVVIDRADEHDLYGRLQ